MQGSGDTLTLMEEEGEKMAVAAAAEAARFYVYAYNTTTLVTTAGLALGIFFIVTSIALYAYYYSGADTSKRSDRSWEKGGTDNSLPDTSRVAGVLGLLEEAWAGYGVEEQACRRRVSCEAELWVSQGVHMPSAVLLSRLIGQVTYDDLAGVSVNEATDVWALRQAAERGRQELDCQTYEQQCPHVSIMSVRRK